MTRDDISIFWDRVQKPTSTETTDISGIFLSFSLVPTEDGFDAEFFAVSNPLPDA